MSNDPRSRRAFLTGLGRSAALVVGAGALARVVVDSDGSSTSATPAPTPTPSAQPVHDDHPPEADPAVVGFLGPVTVGTAIGAWTVARVYGPFRGGLPIVLAHADGRRAQIDLLRTDPASPPGIAATAAGQLYWVNSGRGTATTPPDLEHAIRTLAATLQGDGAELPLVSQAERHRRFPGGVYVVPA